jgi:hypothetical protein
VALALSEVTFPAIYIQGSFVGGGDDVARLHQDDALKGLLDRDRVPFVAGANDTKTPVSFCTQLAGAGVEDGACTSTSRWYTFQIKAYANVVRGVSSLHIAFFVAMLLAFESATSDTGVLVALWLGAILAVDLALFCLLGATPLSMIGNVVTWAVWDVKGNAVPAVPYKVVFVYYVVVLVNIVHTCGFGGGLGLEATGGRLRCWQNHSAEFRGTLIGSITNSGFLAVFRF